MTRTLTLTIDGLHCASCEQRIALELEPNTGVQSVTVRAADGHATIEYDDAQTTADVIVATINDLGYAVTVGGAGQESR